MKAKFNLKGLLASAFMMLSVSMFAQQHTVNGTVVDADNGEPLIGVAVMVSTGGGTTTDANGAYTVSASDDATLTFNTLGYIDVVEKVNGRSQINVKMTVDSKVLEEVVVLGYTSQKSPQGTATRTPLSPGTSADNRQAFPAQGRTPQSAHPSPCGNADVPG